MRHITLNYSDLSVSSNLLRQCNPQLVSGGDIRCVGNDSAANALLQIVELLPPAIEQLNEISRSTNQLLRQAAHDFSQLDAELGATQ